MYELRQNTTESFLTSGSVEEEEDEERSPKTQKSVNLKDSQWEYIQKQSEELELSQNEVLRRILDHYIEEEEEVTE